MRQAFIGFCATIVSDAVSNSLRVVKTYRQVHEREIGYLAAAKEVVATDGPLGLLGRGLKTRIIANGCQGVMFSVLWKLLMDLWVSSLESRWTKLTNSPEDGIRRQILDYPQSRSDWNLVSNQEAGRVKFRRFLYGCWSPVYDGQRFLSRSRDMVANECTR